MVTRNSAGRTNPNAGAKIDIEVNLGDIVVFNQKSGPAVGKCVEVHADHVAVEKDGAKRKTKVEYADVVKSYSGLDVGAVISFVSDGATYEREVESIDLGTAIIGCKLDPEGSDDQYGPWFPEILKDEITVIQPAPGQAEEKQQELPSQEAPQRPSRPSRPAPAQEAPQRPSRPSRPAPEPVLNAHGIDCSTANPGDTVVWDDDGEGVTTKVVANNVGEGTLTVVESGDSPEYNVSYEFVTQLTQYVEDKPQRPSRPAPAQEATQRPSRPAQEATQRPSRSSNLPATGAPPKYDIGIEGEVADEALPEMPVFVKGQAVATHEKLGISRGDLAIRQGDVAKVLSPIGGRGLIGARSDMPVEVVVLTGRTYFEEIVPYTDGEYEWKPATFDFKEQVRNFQQSNSGAKFNERMRAVIAVLLPQHLEEELKDDEFLQSAFQWQLPSGIAVCLCTWSLKGYDVGRWCQKMKTDAQFKLGPEGKSARHRVWNIEAEIMEGRTNSFAASIIERGVLLSDEDAAFLQSFADSLTNRAPSETSDEDLPF